MGLNVLGARTRAVTSLVAAGALLVGVSGSALADQPQKPPVVLNFSTQGVGTYTQSGDPGCQFTTAGCTVKAGGTGTMTVGGTTLPITFTSTIHVDYAHAQSLNNNTTFCAPATANVTLTSVINTADSITKTETGQVCGGQQAYAPHSFTGTYTITGGTGIFADANGGTGTVTSQDNGLSGSASMLTSSEQGTVTFSKEPKLDKDDRNGPNLDKDDRNGPNGDDRSHPGNGHQNQD